MEKRKIASSEKAGEAKTSIVRKPENYSTMAAGVKPTSFEIRMVIDFSAISGHSKIITNAIGAIRKDEIEDPLGVAEPYSGVYVINTRKLGNGKCITGRFFNELGPPAIKQ